MSAFIKSPFYSRVAYQRLIEWEQSTYRRTLLTMRSSLPFGQFPIGITLLLLLMASSASASDGMRCGSKVITDGESRERVLALCGEPAGVTQSYIMRQPSYSRNNRVVYYGNHLAEVMVETWTYNFGPNKLMRRLRFVDGILEDIVTLGYGYNPP